MTNPPIPCGKSPGALVGGLEPLNQWYYEKHEESMISTPIKI